MARDIEEKIEELKEHIHQKLSVNKKHFEETCEKIFQKFKNEFKQEFAKELEKRDEKIKKLESDKVILQKHILEIQKQNLTNQSEIEELEQYGRRKCLRFEGFPLNKVKPVIKCYHKLWICVKKLVWIFLIR